MLNHIVLMGRLTRDPELRRTQSGIAVASFSLAVDRDWSSKDTGEKATDFINIVAWRSTAEFVSKWFTKGKQVAVSGRLQMRDWTDKDGNKRTTAEVVADNVYFADSKSSGSTQQSSYSDYNAPAANSYQSSSYSNSGYGNISSEYKSEYSEIEDDGDLPF